MRKILENFINLLEIENIDYIILSKNLKEKVRKISNENSIFNSINDSFDEILKKINYQENILGYIEEYNNIGVFNCVYDKYIIFIDLSNTFKKAVYYMFTLNQIVSNIEESVIITNKENKIHFVNRVFLDRYGYKFSDLKDSYITELLLPEYMETVIESIINLELKKHNIEIYNNLGESVNVEIQCIHLKNSNLFIIKDKTEKEIYNKQIEGLKQLQHLIFDSISQGIVVLDKETNILQFNKFMEERYKFSKSDYIGKSIFELVPDLKKLGFERIFADIIENKRVKKLFNVRRYSKRLKKELIQNFVGYPIVENNRAIGVVVLLEDVTAIKVLEEEFEINQKKQKLLNEFNSILSKSLDIETVYFEISKYLMDFLYSDHIITYNTLNKEYREYKRINKKIQEKIFTEEYVEKHFSFKDNITKNIVIIKKSEKIYSMIKKKGYKELINIPIIFQQKFLGFFIILLKNKISDNRLIIESLEDFQNNLGYIIDKSFIFEEKKVNLHKLEFILKISRLLSRIKDVNIVFNQLISTIVDELKADNAIFLAGDNNNFRVVSVYGKDSKKLLNKNYNDDIILNKVYKDREGMIIENTKKSKNNYNWKKQSLIAIPLIYKGEFLGIFLLLKQYGVFNLSDYEMLKIIATSSSSFIKNVLLQIEMEKQIEQLSILYKISTSIRSIVNLTLLKKVIVSSLTTLLKSDFTIILEESSNGYKITESFFKNLSLKRIYINNTDNIPKKYFNKLEKNNILFIENVHIKLKYLIKNKLENVLLINLSIKNNKDYIILLGYKDSENKLSIDTYMAIIHELSIKIENAYLFEESEKKLRQFESISNITKEIATSKNDELSEYLNHIVTAAKNIVNGTYATLLLRKDNYLYFEAASGIDIEILKNIKIKIGDGVAGHVVKTGKSVIINNPKEKSYFKVIKTLNSLYTIKNLINIPLVYKGEILGVLCVDNKKDGDFNKNDAKFIEALAYSTIIAIERFLNLEVSKHFSDIILDNIPSGIIYIGHNGKLKHINKGFLTISGYNEKDILNKKYNDIFEDNERMIDKVIKTKKNIYRREINLLKANGEKIPCGISITPIKSTKTSDIVCIIQDLSNIKRIQRELKEKENLALLGQMAAGMAHEIKNPLAGILTGMEFLYMQLSEVNPVYKESMELIIREVKRLDRLVNDMTSFAKSKMKIISKVKIDELINRAIELTKNKYHEKNIKLITEFPKNIPYINIDEEQILEVLINIIINAAQALDTEGKVKITVNFKNNNCHIVIFNDGPPIPQEILNKIFTPFFTTKSGGTGLGLAISYNIIKEHGGKLNVKNEKNGVAFEIILPMKVKNAQ